MDTLSAQEQELLMRFVYFTNYPHEPLTAVHYLEETNWNLGSAVMLYFESSPDANSNHANHANHANHSNTNHTSTSNNNGAGASFSSGIGSIAGVANSFFSAVRARVLYWKSRNGSYLPISTQDFQPPRGFFNLNFSNQCFYVIQVLLYFPILLCYKMVSFLFIFLTKTFPKLAQFTARYSQNRHSSKSDPKGVDPAHTARNFINEFNTFYKNSGVNYLDFYEGGYTSALYIAKRDARFLVIYLHNDEHDNTNEFVNETLLNENLLKFFRDHNILVWGGDVHESESYQVANALSVSSFPFLGLLCLKTNSQETPQGTTQTTPTLTCVARIQGLCSAEKVIAKFSNQIERSEPTLIAIRTERQQQELSRVLRQQQDQAYQASLERDRLLEEQRRQERLLQHNRGRYLKWRLATLKPEVDASQTGEYSRIAIRLSDGKRITRRFSKNVSIEEIYAFVELRQKGLLNSSVDLTATRPTGFVYEYPFNLISVIPREELSCSQVVKIKDCSLVWPSGNLVVEQRV